MRWIFRLSYAVGHVFNDLTASVWFTYTLVYFQFGLNMPASLAGIIMLVGQFADALATPVVGIGADYSTSLAHITSQGPSLWAKLTAWFPRGRLAWHFTGSLLILFSFPFIFSPIYGGQNADNWAKLVYYLPIVVLFQLGWAAVQISHLALMNDLTTDTNERVILTSMRYFFTVLSNLVVFLSALFLLERQIKMDLSQESKGLDHIFSDNSKFTLLVDVRNKTMPQNYSELSKYNAQDFLIFRSLAYMIVVIGAILCTFFHILIWIQQSRNIVDETDDISPLINNNEEIIANDTSTCNENQILHFKDWFRNPQFWLTVFIYMTNRLIINISQVYISFYLLVSLMLPKLTLSLIPMTVYVASMLTSTLQKPFYKYFNREVTCLFGMSFVFVFCLLVHYPDEPPAQMRIYAGAILLGVGWAFLLITSLAMVGDLVEGNTSTGAFVYGVASFADKLAGGIVIQIIQALKPTSDRQLEKLYYKYAESYLIEAFLCLVGIFVLIRFVVRRTTSLPTIHQVQVDDTNSSDL